MSCRTCVWQQVPGWWKQLVPEYLMQACARVPKQCPWASSGMYPSSHGQFHTTAPQAVVCHCHVRPPEHLKLQAVSWQYKPHAPEPHATSPIHLSSHSACALLLPHTLPNPVARLLAKQHPCRLPLCSSPLCSCHCCCCHCCCRTQPILLPGCLPSDLQATRPLRICGNCLRFTMCITGKFWLPAHGIIFNI